MSYKNFDYVLAAKIEGIVMPSAQALGGVPKFTLSIPRPDLAWTQRAGIRLNDWRDGLLYMPQDKDKMARLVELMEEGGYHNPADAIAAFNTHFQTDASGTITQISENVFWNYFIGGLSEEGERDEKSRGPVRHFRKDWVTIDDYIRGAHSWKTEQFWQNEQLKRAAGGR